MAATRLVLGELPSAPGLYDFFPYTQTVYYDGQRFYPAGPSATASRSQSSAPPPVSAAEQQQQQPQQAASSVCGNHRAAAPRAGELSFARSSTPRSLAAEAKTSAPVNSSASLPSVLQLPARVPAAASGFSTLPLSNETGTSRVACPPHVSPHTALPPLGNVLASSHGAPTNNWLTGPHGGVISRRNSSVEADNEAGESSDEDGSVEEVEFNLGDVYPAPFQSNLTEEQPRPSQPPRKDTQLIDIPAAIDKPSADRRTSATSELCTTETTKDGRALEINPGPGRSSVAVTDAPNKAGLLPASKTPLHAIPVCARRPAGPVALGFLTERALENDAQPDLRGEPQVKAPALDNGVTNAAVATLKSKPPAPLPSGPTGRQNRASFAAASTSVGPKGLVASCVVTGKQRMGFPLSSSRRKTAPVPDVDGWGMTDDENWGFPPTTSSNVTNNVWETWTSAKTWDANGWDSKASSFERKDKIRWSTDRSGWSTHRPARNRSGWSADRSRWSNAAAQAKATKGAHGGWDAPSTSPVSLSLDITKSDTVSSANDACSRRSSMPVSVNHCSVSGRRKTNSVNARNTESSGLPPTPNDFAVHDRTFYNMASDASPGTEDAAKGASAKSALSEDDAMGLGRAMSASGATADLGANSEMSSVHAAKRSSGDFSATASFPGQIKPIAERDAAAFPGKSERPSEQAVTVRDAGPRDNSALPSGTEDNKQMAGATEAGVQRDEADVVGLAVLVNSSRQSDMLVVFGGKQEYKEDGEEEGYESVVALRMEGSEPVCELISAKANFEELAPGSMKAAIVADANAAVRSEKAGHLQAIIAEPVEGRSQLLARSLSLSGEEGTAFLPEDDAPGGSNEGRPVCHLEKSLTPLAGEESASRFEDATAGQPFTQDVEQPDASPTERLHSPLEGLTTPVAPMSDEELPPQAFKVDSAEDTLPWATKEATALGNNAVQGSEDVASPAASTAGEPSVTKFADALATVGEDGRLWRGAGQTARPQSDERQSPAPAPAVMRGEPRSRPADGHRADDESVFDLVAEARCVPADDLANEALRVVGAEDTASHGRRSHSAPRGEDAVSAQPAREGKQPFCSHMDAVPIADKDARDKEDAPVSRLAVGVGPSADCRKKPLFRCKFLLPKGKTVFLTYYENEDPLAVAERFCEAWWIPDSFVPEIAGRVESAIHKANMRDAAT